MAVTQAEIHQDASPIFHGGGDGSNVAVRQHQLLVTRYFELALADTTTTKEVREGMKKMQAMRVCTTMYHEVV
jgi:hypothetical protein